MIILKVTKDQGFTFSLEDTFFKKLQGGGQIDTPPPAVLGLKAFVSYVAIKMSTCHSNF